MERPFHTPRPAEEISIFCPVRLYLGRKRFDGLVDTLDSRGGTFYLMSEEEPPHPGTEERFILARERKGELVLSGGNREFRVPCKVRGMRFDEDGLYIYVGLKFLLDSEDDRRRLETFVASLW